MINNNFNRKVKGKERELMKLIDNINNKFGHGKLRLSSDCDKSFFPKKNNENNRDSIWQTKSKYRSPCYTTSWYDIPKVKV